MKVVAAVLMAGKGERFGTDKSRAVLGGLPLWRWSYDALSRHPEVSGVGLVCNDDNIEEATCQASSPLFVVRGGNTRTASSRAALEALPCDTDVLLLHDSARPFVDAGIVSQVIAATVRSGAAAPGITPSDTIKIRESNSLRTLDRNSLVAVQTPQGIRPDVLRIGLQKLALATDDLALAEAAGIVPEIVQGDPANIKITVSDDLERAEQTLPQPSPIGNAPEFEFRTGIGYDIHPFSTDSNRKLFLGGVQFEGSPGLEGHSDADVLLHAITDAILGAASLGDIGMHFPNDEPKWKNQASSQFLQAASRLVNGQGWQIVHIDATVIAESPRLCKDFQEIKSQVAASAGIESGQVNIKATTNEGLGAIGRNEGIAAMAVASLRRSR